MTGYPTVDKRLMGRLKKTSKSMLQFSQTYIFIFSGYNFDVNGSY